MTSQQHNPGAPLAVAAGCTCNPEINHNGAGEPINGGLNHRWYLEKVCPLHNPRSAFDVANES